MKLNKKQFKRYLDMFEDNDIHKEMMLLFNNDTFYLEENTGWQERNEYEYKLYNKSQTYYDELTCSGYSYVINGKR